MSNNRGRGPVHKNRYAWKPNAGVKINETEVGGKLRPLSEITGVCPRCREQIDWKRRYGKYKQLTEPSKCQRCSKRAVRQAYHSLCAGCAKEHNVCAKCCCRVDRIVGRDLSEVEAEQKMLEEAIKNARERDKRTLLRAARDILRNHFGYAFLQETGTAPMMNKAKSNSSAKTPSDQGNKVGDIFPDASLEEYAAKSRGDKGNNDEDIDIDDVDNETGDGDHEDEVDEDENEDGDRICD